MNDDIAFASRNGLGKFTDSGFQRSALAGERILTLATLQQCGGVKEKAAQTLGVSLKTLYNRLREYDSRTGAPAADPD